MGVPVVLCNLRLSITSDMNIDKGMQGPEARSTGTHSSSCDLPRRLKKAQLIRNLNSIRPNRRKHYVLPAGHLRRLDAIELRIVFFPTKLTHRLV